MLPKPSKEFAIRYIQKLLPDYGLMLAQIQKDSGWIKPESWLLKILDNLNINDYSQHYTVENVLSKLLVDLLFDADEWKEITTELEQASDEERTAFLDEWITTIEQDEFDDVWNSIKLPKTPEEEEEARKLRV
jgi:hypothetical protein